MGWGQLLRVGLLQLNRKLFHRFLMNSFSYRRVQDWVLFKGDKKKKIVRASQKRVSGNHYHFYCFCTELFFYEPTAFATPRSGEIRTQKLKSHLVRTQSLIVLPLKSGVGQCMATHCYTYCHGFLPRLFLPFRSIHLHFFKNLSRYFFLCWLWLTPVTV